MRVNTDDKKKKRKLILSGAALVISALLLAISYAWFCTQREMTTAAWIKAPIILDIRAGNYQDIKYLDMGDIPVLAYIPSDAALAEFDLKGENVFFLPKDAAIVRGGYVLVTQDSPSASKADTTMEAPEGFVYVAVKTGVSDDDYTQIVSGIQEGDTIGYDPNSVSSDSYYDDGSGMMIF